jgi:ATP/maltotriose-dependent transcriptional regulator MalT
MLENHSAPTTSDRPRLPNPHLPRPRLVDAIFDSLTGPKIVLVHAPAGYGKTVLLTECLNRELSPAIYFRLEPRNQDPVSLLQFLIKGVETIRPEAAQHAQRVYMETQIVDAGYRELARALKSETSTFLLILDDYQTVESGLINQKIEIFADRLPENCCMILSARYPPELPLARWSAEGRLAMIGTKDLRFTQDETEILVSSMLGRALDPVEAELLEQDFEGWVLGLVLSVGEFRNRPPKEFVDFLTHERGLTWATQSALQQQVIEAYLHDHSEQDHVYKMSIFSEIAVDVCNDFLGIQSVGELLRSFERRGLFISRTDRSGMHYRYHRPFRHFLRAELHRRIGASAVQTLHLRAAQVYEQHGTWQQAISHYLAAGAHQAAAAIIESRSNEFFDYSTALLEMPHSLRLASHELCGTLSDWFKMLPSAVMDAHPNLLFLKGQILLLANKCSQARPLLEKALVSYRAEGSFIYEARAAARLASIAYHERRHQEAIDLLAGMSSQNLADPDAQVEVLLELAVNHSALGNIRAALEAGEAAWKIAAGETLSKKSLILEMVTARWLAYLYCDAGQLDGALIMAERACAISRDETIGVGGTLAENLCARADALIARGDFKAALKTVEELDHMCATGMLDQCDHQRLASLRGEIAIVNQDYEKAEAHFLEDGHQVTDLIHLRLMQGNLCEARDLANVELASHGDNSSPTARYVAQVWCGIVESQMGNFGPGQRMLECAAQFFKEKGMEYWLAGAELHLAWLLARLGQRSLSLQSLTSALAYGARVNAMNFPFWHPGVTTFACVQALIANLQTDYVTALVRSRLSPADARYFRPLLRHSSKDIRRRAAKAFEVLGLTDKETLVASQELGHKPRHLSQEVESLVTQGHLTHDGAVRLSTNFRLTSREIEVFAWYVHPSVRDGQRRVNEAIASRLVLSEGTVREHISTILKKLDAHSRDRLQLHSLAINEGIVRT